MKAIKNIKYFFIPFIMLFPHNPGCTVPHRCWVCLLLLRCPSRQRAGKCGFVFFSTAEKIVSNSGSVPLRCRSLSRGWYRNGTLVHSDRSISRFSNSGSPTLFVIVTVSLRSLTGKPLRRTERMLPAMLPFAISTKKMCID